MKWIDATNRLPRKQGNYFVKTTPRGCGLSIAMEIHTLGEIKYLIKHHDVFWLDEDAQEGNQDEVLEELYNDFKHFAMTGAMKGENTSKDLEIFINHLKTKFDIILKK